MTVPVAHAALTTPPGLLPGDQFHWAFVTSVHTTAESADISYYNTFVNSAAKASDALTADVPGDWKAIGSTASVNASANVGTITYPIYNLARELVATDGPDLWDDDNLIHAINRTEHNPDLTAQGYWVWTGTLADGTAAAGYALGSTYPVRGVTNSLNEYWIDVREGTNNTWKSDTISHMYAISAVQTVVPIPGAVWLLGSGLIGIVGVRRKFKK